MDEPETTRRRWLTHERALLLIVALVVTLGLSWLGWQAFVVGHRKAMREQITASTCKGFAYPRGSKSLWVSEWVRGPLSDRSVSKIRELLGDSAFPLIRFNHPLTAADREATEAFPEAVVAVLTASPPFAESESDFPAGAP